MASSLAWRTVDDLFYNPAVYRLLRSMVITKPADRNVIKAAAAVTGATVAAKASADGNPDQSAPLEQICLMPEAQLKQHMDRATILDRHAMQMPPYLQVWSERSDTRLLRDDARHLDGCLPPGQKIVTVDIGIKEKVAPHDRFVAIRENNGRLRTPTRSERRDLLQTYFPLPHRRTVVPSLFAVEKNLARLLSPEVKKYVYVLDRATVQFEPNEPEYVRIRDRVYDAVDAAKAYGELQTTRHFGGLVLHLVLHRRAAGLTSYLVQTEQLERCLHLLRLRVAIHESDAKSLQNFDLPFVLNEAKAFDEQHKIGMLVCLIKLEPSVSRLAAPLLEQLRRAAGSAGLVGRPAGWR